MRRAKARGTGVQLPSPPPFDAPAPSLELGAGLLMAGLYVEWCPEPVEGLCMNSIYYVYILQDAAGAYYVGHTHDLVARVLAHQSGQGGSHTRKLVSPKLVYSEAQPTLIAAIKRERQIKGWSRAKKWALIERNPNELIKLSRSREASQPFLSEPEKKSIAEGFKVTPERLSLTAIKDSL